MALIDTHIHLDGFKNHKHLYKIFNEFNIYALCVTNSPDIFMNCINAYFQTKYVKFALGFHPNLVGKIKFDYKDFANKGKLTDYIGEVGLDFSHSYYKYREQQINIFNEIVEYATENNKLLSIHSNRAVDEVIEVIENNKPRRFIMHWYKGNLNQTKKLVELGAYFSINIDQISDGFIKTIPIDRVLVETDGPHNKTLKSNYSYKALYDLYSVLGDKLSVEEFQSKVYENFKKLLTK